MHQAAQEGSFHCLKLFTHQSPTCIIKRDGYGKTPVNYAAKYRRIKCWELLLVAQFKENTKNDITQFTQARLLKWYRSAKDRVALNSESNKGSMATSINSMTVNKAHIGNPLSVDGYNSFQFLSEKLLPMRQSIEEKENIREFSKTLPSNALKGKSEAKDTVVQLKNSHSKAFGKTAYKNVNEKSALTLERIPQRKKLLRKRAVRNAYDAVDKSRKRLTSDEQASRIKLDDLSIQATGMSSHQLAEKCLTFGQSFERKIWMAQLNIALKSSKNALQAHRRYVNSV